MEEATQQPTKRPLFLTLLCICTYIGVVVCIIASVLAIGTIDSMIHQYQDAQNFANSFLNPIDLSINNMPGMGDVDEAVHSIEATAYIMLGILNFMFILCLVGAIMMWKRKRMGFYIYGIGELLPAVTALWFQMKFSMFVPDEMINLSYTFIGTSVLFLVLYTLNLKHLR